MYRFFKFLFIFSLFLNSKLVLAENIVNSLYNNIESGLVNAYKNGYNGILLSGYAYHFSVAAHWPSPTFAGLNEIPLGLGYSRSYYNKNDEEYTLYILGFADTYYKPELHIGYLYQKYFPINGSDNLKWGIGYTPMIFFKPRWTWYLPIPLPGIGLSSSVKYKNFTLLGTLSEVLYLNVKIDFK